MASEHVVPLAVIEREMRRVGYTSGDGRSILLGYMLGAHPEYLADEAKIRWIVETLMSGDTRGPHLPRPGDASYDRDPTCLHVGCGHVRGRHDGPDGPCLVGHNEIDRLVGVARCECPGYVGSFTASTRQENTGSMDG